MNKKNRSNKQFEIVDSHFETIITDSKSECDLLKIPLDIDFRVLQN